MTVLLGGMRVLNTNFGQTKHGVLAVLRSLPSNRSLSSETAFQVVPISSRFTKKSFVRIDLIFGSNSEVRALAEVYAAADSQKKSVDDFVAAWTKVMNLDRFDLA